MKKLFILVGIVWAGGAMATTVIEPGERDRVCTWQLCDEEDKDAGIHGFGDLVYCEKATYRCSYSYLSTSSITPPSGVTPPSGGTSTSWDFKRFHGRVVTCEKCRAGYHTVTEQINGAPSPMGCNDDVSSHWLESYDVCVPDCNNCPGGCPGSRKDLKNGYIEIKTCTCECSSCVCDRQYECAPGYYGTANAAGNAGCVLCPPVKDKTGAQFYGTSPGGNNTSKTTCYMPKGTRMVDERGSFTYGENCTYRNPS